MNNGQLPVAKAHAVKTRLFGLAIFVSVQPAWALEADQVFERVNPSIWRVMTLDAEGKPLGQGSGVVIAPNTMVTNCHVLAKARRVNVVKDSMTLSASLQMYDPERDLCQLNVDKLVAPAVSRATEAQLRIGAKVYAIGNPRGLDLSLSDGLISALRKDKESKLERIQTTAPISPGSSGGGLFDSEARLVGLTTSQMVNGQNLNFAIPADWIAELPKRHAELAAKREQQKPANTTATQAVQQAAPLQAGKYLPGDTFEYSVLDKNLGRSQRISLRVDSNDGREVRLNDGALVLNTEGEVLSLRSPFLSELDFASPPGGWGSAARMARSAGELFNLRYNTTIQGISSDYWLQASLVGDDVVKVADQELQVKRYALTGRMTRNPPGVTMNASGPYEATLWYSDALKRPIRYEVSARSVGAFGPHTFIIKEEVALQRLRRQ
jgi:serine protease Do